MSNTSNLDNSHNINILDLATGTGDMVFLLRDMLNRHLASQTNNYSIQGIDFSQAMLDIANNRRINHIASNRTIDNVNTKFSQGDIMSLPIEDNSINGIIISYGLRNVIDYEQCLKEIYRVLKPNGILIILDMSEPQGFFKYLSLMHRLYIVPFIGQIITGNKQAYEYLVHSIKQYLDQKELLSLLEQCQYKNVKYINLLSGISAIHYAQK